MIASELFKLKLNAVKSQRNNEEVKSLLLNLDKAARDGSNVMPHILNAVEAYASLGEISDTMRNVFGEYSGN